MNDEQEEIQANKFLFIFVVGFIGLCLVWHGVGWVYDLVIDYV